MDPLEAITPVDGRYRERLERLSAYFSEYALIRERVAVEVEYLANFIERVEPGKLSALPPNWREMLSTLARNFDIEKARRVKEIEGEVGHDVAAVTRFLREELHKLDVGELAPYVHIGLTSEDVNNLALSRLLTRFNREALLPELAGLLEQITTIALEHVETVMLGRTHGIPAVPTTFGRFLANYAYRIAKISEGLHAFRFPGKLGGAVGDHSALKFSYPNVDWVEFSRFFVESMGLEYFPASTQILPHDRISEYLMRISILDSILSNLCRDLWIMSSLGLIHFGIRRGEIHSSTMPHKSNPILLENAEGAFDLASETSSYISRRLLSSRLHRDLSDSIIKRFYGLPLSLTILGIVNLRGALARMSVDSGAMKREVEAHPEVLAEAFQVSMRKMGIEEAYEAIQEALKAGWSEVLDALKAAVPRDVYEELAGASPTGYLGEAGRITLMLLEEVKRICRGIAEDLSRARP